jgi:ADP-heptose:LPS heptosyltransferase
MALAARHGMKIAVFRPLGLGELLLTVPALRALDAAYPAAHITLVGAARSRPLALRLRRYLDGYLEFPGFPGIPGRANLNALPGFFDQARAARFDLVLQMQGSGELANPLVLLMGGARTAGYYRFGRFCPDPGRYLPWHDEESEVERSLHLLEHLGAPAKGTQLEFPVQEGDLREAGRFGADGYAVAHPDPGPGASWTAARFAELGDALVAEGLPVALTGTARSGAVTRAIREAMREPALDLAGRTTLGSFGALVMRARLLVTAHPGVAVLAAATRTPAVLIAPGATLQDALQDVARALACAA